MPQRAGDRRFHRLAAQLKQEHWFELCAHFVNHFSWSFAYKTRSSLFPRGAAQLPVAARLWNEAHGKTQFSADGLGEPSPKTSRKRNTSGSEIKNADIL
jgi:hypothetical protein